MTAVRECPKEEEGMGKSGKGQPGCPAYLGKIARRHRLLLGMLSRKADLPLVHSPLPKGAFCPTPEWNPLPAAGS